MNTQDTRTAVLYSAKSETYYTYPLLNTAAMELDHIVIRKRPELDVIQVCDTPEAARRFIEDFAPLVMEKQREWGYLDD
jgi:hypothetical protein